MLVCKRREERVFVGVYIGVYECIYVFLNERERESESALKGMSNPRTLICNFVQTLKVQFRKLNYHSSNIGTLDQCGQIGRFITLWANFQSLWQQLFCPNCQHFKAIFVRVSKTLIFSSKFLFGQLLQAFGDFLLVTLIHLDRARGRQQENLFRFHFNQ